LRIREDPSAKEREAFSKCERILQRRREDPFEKEKRPLWNLRMKEDPFPIWRESFHNS
jgi:hypothetical protein